MLQKVIFTQKSFKITQINAIEKHGFGVDLRQNHPMSETMRSLVAILRTMLYQGISLKNTPPLKNEVSANKGGYFFKDFENPCGPPFGNGLFFGRQRRPKNP